MQRKPPKKRFGLALKAESLSTPTSGLPTFRQSESRPQAGIGKMAGGLWRLASTSRRNLDSMTTRGGQLSEVRVPNRYLASSMPLSLMIRF